MGKCPLKFRLYQFEGGEECDPECMWLVEAFPNEIDADGNLRKKRKVCSMALPNAEWRKTLNWKEGS